jgi:hypothetical protein
MTRARVQRPAEVACRPPRGRPRREPALARILVAAATDPRVVFEDLLSGARQERGEALWGGLDPWGFHLLHWPVG